MKLPWLVSGYRELRKLKIRFPFPSDSKRLISSSRKMLYSHYVRILRDSFPKDDRLCFGWGYFPYEFFLSRMSSSFRTSLTTIRKEKTFFWMDTPLIGRTMFNDSKTRRRGYFRVGLHCATDRLLAEFNLPPTADSSRLKRIFTDTRTMLQPYRQSGKHIIYALQVSYDTPSVLKDLHVYEAAQLDLLELRKHTQRPIIVTMHPEMIRHRWSRNLLKIPSVHQHYMRLQALCSSLQIKFFDKFEKPRSDSTMFLQDCWCVVCHSSEFAMDALLAGVPVVTLYSGNFLHPICSHSLKDVENPSLADRLAWLSRLAYCQWTLEEIASGACYRHFAPLLDRLLQEKAKAEFARKT